MSEGDYEYRDWEKRVPHSLLPTVGRIRDSFREAEWVSNWTTQAWCYAQLHPDDKGASDGAGKYRQSLEHLKRSLKPISRQSIQNNLQLGTPPATLKAFSDMHTEVMSLRAQDSFQLLFEFADSHPDQLSATPSDWAFWQVQSMIRMARRQIGLWLKCCCDTQQFDVNDKSDEYIFWRKWQAPMFVSMQPSLGRRPLDPARLWEREDLESTGEVIDLYERCFVLYVESAVATQVESCQHLRRANQPAVSHFYVAKTGTSL